jgi:hypothetical protein
VKRGVYGVKNAVYTSLQLLRPGLSPIYGEGEWGFKVDSP